MDYPLERLPKLVGGTDIVGHLSPRAAEQLGLSPVVPIVAGGGDGQCAAVGCGVIQPGLCMINIGTATGVQVFLPRPFWQESGAIGFGAHVLPEAWEMEEHTQASGVVLRWMRDEFCQDLVQAAGRSGAEAFDLLVDEACQAPPGSEGLVFIPTFNGVTGAHANPLARGVLLGLRLSHRRAHLIRAILEGITYEIRWMLEAIQGTGASVEQVRLVGGGSKNPHWNQIHADILGYPVSTLQNNEAALVGAAVCAAVGIGEYANAQEAVQQFVHIKECIQPHHPLRSIYDAAFDIFVKTYTLLSKEGVFDSLHAMIEKGESATI